MDIPLPASLNPLIHADEFRVMAKIMQRTFTEVGLNPLIHADEFRVFKSNQCFSNIDALSQSAYPRG